MNSYGAGPPFNPYRAAFTFAPSGSSSAAQHSTTAADSSLYTPRRSVAPRASFDFNAASSGGGGVLYRDPATGHIKARPSPSDATAAAVAASASASRADADYSSISPSPYGLIGFELNPRSTGVPSRHGGSLASYSGGKSGGGLGSRTSPDLLDYTALLAGAGSSPSLTDQAMAAYSSYRSHMRSPLVAPSALLLADYAASHAQPNAIGSGASIMSPHLNTSHTSAALSPPPVRDEKHDPLAAFTLSIPGVALEPMSATDVLATVNSKTDEVVTRYLPCVDFLVACQQDLRAGLAAATKKKQVNRHVFRDSMTPRQFFNHYLQPLPNRFLTQNQPIMPQSELHTAYYGIQALCTEAKRVEFSGCEAMKNAFLGGMRDGESWGLRQWLSKNGGALKICNDLELILGAIQKLDRNADTTKILTERIRPKAKQALDRLKNDVPTAYQEVSTAHPYLPFFHRMESALRGLANFDPEEDDVICLDDSDGEGDEVEEIKSSLNLHPLKKPPYIRTTENTLPLNNELKRSATAVVEKAPPKKKLKVEVANEHCGEDEDGILDSLLGPLGYGSLTSDNDDSDGDIEVLCVRTAGGSLTKVAAESITDAQGEANAIEAEGDVFGQQAGSTDAHAQELLDTYDPASLFDQRSCSSQQALTTESEEKRNNLGWRCTRCTFLNNKVSIICSMCDDGDEHDGGFAEAAAAAATLEPLVNMIWGNPASDTSTCADAASSSVSVDRSVQAKQLMQQLENIIQSETVGQNPRTNKYFDPNDFWNSAQNYVYILKLFKNIMAMYPESHRFIGPIDKHEDFKYSSQLYHSVIKNPICFSDIVTALTTSGDELETSHQSSCVKRQQGQLDLNLSGLSQWNMRNGRDLIQAIDLVLLNAIAFNGKVRTELRNDAQKLRKLVWDGICKKADFVKKNIPTKRGETSGFVIRKTL